MLEQAKTVHTSDRAAAVNDTRNKKCDAENMELEMLVNIHTLSALLNMSRWVPERRLAVLCQSLASQSFDFFFRIRYTHHTPVPGEYEYSSSKKTGALKLGPKNKMAIFMETA
jgi:hypothetical protein